MRLVHLVQDGSAKNTGLPDNHPLVGFARNPDELDNALALDDTVIWGALSIMSEAVDQTIAQFAYRLRDRKFTKAIYLRTQVARHLMPTERTRKSLYAQIDLAAFGL